MKAGIDNDNDCRCCDGCKPKTPFESKVEDAINTLSLYNELNTPYFILSEFIDNVLWSAYHLIKGREKWYNVHCEPGKLKISLKTFIEHFSHNNEVWIENKHCYCMMHKNFPGDETHDGIVMDWSLQYSDIAECNVIRIDNVIHEGHMNAFTIVVDTEEKVFTYLPELVKEGTSPLWFYDRTHQTNTIARAEG